MDVWLVEGKTILEDVSPCEEEEAKALNGLDATEVAGLKRKGPFFDRLKAASAKWQARGRAPTVKVVK